MMTIPSLVYCKRIERRDLYLLPLDSLHPLALVAATFFSIVTFHKKETSLCDM